MNYKRFLFFILIMVVSISVAAHLKRRKPVGAALSGNVDAVKVVCLPYNSPEIRRGADITMKKNGVIAKFQTTKNKMAYVCYVKFYANKSAKQHAGTYKCKGLLFQPQTCQLQINAGDQGTQLKSQWNNLAAQAVMFDKLQPAVQYLNQDPTVEKLPVYTGAGQ